MISTLSPPELGLILLVLLWGVIAAIWGVVRGALGHADALESGGKALTCIGIALLLTLGVRGLDPMDTIPTMLPVILPATFLVIAAVALGRSSFRRARGSASPSSRNVNGAG